MNSKQEIVDGTDPQKFVAIFSAEEDAEGFIDAVCKKLENNGHCEFQIDARTTTEDVHSDTTEFIVNVSASMVGTGLLEFLRYTAKIHSGKIFRSERTDDGPAADPTDEGD